jgi:hypothetical protein
MNTDFNQNNFLRASSKRLKQLCSGDCSRKQRPKHGDKRMTPKSQSKDRSAMDAETPKNVISPIPQTIIQLCRNPGDNNTASKSVTPDSKEKTYSGLLGTETAAPITGGGALTGTIPTEDLADGRSSKGSAPIDHNAIPPAGLEYDENRESNPYADDSDSSNDSTDDDNMDDDEKWLQEKMKKRASSIDELLIDLEPSFSDNESTTGYTCDKRFASKPDVCPGSMKEIMKEQKTYSEKVNEEVKSLKYAAKIPYPKHFLPETLHKEFFEYMESHDAHKLCRSEKWTNVVNIMISYLLAKTLSRWAGEEPLFPKETALISLRNLFKMWYCNVFGIKVDYSKRKRGRGFQYSEEEVFAIEFGMYKYPVISSTAFNNSVDFLWGAILADDELSEVLKDRTRYSVMDKVLVFNKEKIWDSLGFFYFQQQKLADKVQEMKLRVKVWLKDDKGKKKMKSNKVFPYAANDSKINNY